jgi:hypothetical protein
MPRLREPDRISRQSENRYSLVCVRAGRSRAGLLCALPVVPADRRFSRDRVALHLFHAAGPVHAGCPPTPCACGPSISGASKIPMPTGSLPANLRISAHLLPCWKVASFAASPKETNCGRHTHLVVPEHRRRLPSAAFTPAAYGEAAAWRHAPRAPLRLSLRLKIGCIALNVDQRNVDCHPGLRAPGIHPLLRIPEGAGELLIPALLSSRSIGNTTCRTSGDGRTGRARDMGDPGRPRHGRERTAAAWTAEWRRVRSHESHVLKEPFAGLQPERTRPPAEAKSSRDR